MISSESQVISEVQETQVVHNKNLTSNETVTTSETDKKPTQQSSNKHSMEHLQSSSLPKQHHVVHKPVIIARQPPTKPVAVLGMERRAQRMAERRQARENRKRQREEELLVSCYINSSIDIIHLCKFESRVLKHCRIVKSLSNSLKFSSSEQ